MSTSIKVPATVEAAKQQLGAVGALLTAKEWERAAIVYAFTRMDIHTLSLREFTALGIVGLTDKNTVGEYRKAWEWAIDNGMAVPVAPGDEVTLPNVKWPPGIIDHKRGTHATTAEVEAGVTKLIEAEPEKVVAKLVEKNRKALVDAIAETPAIGDEVTEATAAVRAARAMPRPAPTLNAERVLQVVADALNEFWKREVQAGPNRVTFQQVVETVVQNRASPSLRSRIAPTVMLDNELMDALAKHIDLSEDIRDGKTLTTGKALVGGGN